MTQSQAERILQEQGGGIRFITAVEDGKPCWFYLRVPKEKLAAYDAALAQGSMDIRDYGQILESDFGYYPPADVVAFMHNEYGFVTPVLQR